MQACDGYVQSRTAEIQRHLRCCELEGGRSWWGVGYLEYRIGDVEWSDGGRQSARRVAYQVSGPAVYGGFPAVGLSSTLTSAASTLSSGPVSTVNSQAASFKWGTRYVSYPVNVRARLTVAIRSMLYSLFYVSTLS